MSTAFELSDDELLSADDIELYGAENESDFESEFDSRTTSDSWTECPTLTFYGLDDGPLDLTEMKAAWMRTQNHTDPHYVPDLPGQEFSLSKLSISVVDLDSSVSSGM